MTATSIALISLILGNLAVSLSDVALKLLEGGVSPFQYIFIRQLVATIIIAPIWYLKRDRKTEEKSWVIDFIRAHLVIIGAGCSLVAITNLPLATANAVFYAAPLIMLPLAVLLLKEKPSKKTLILTLIGFIGVVIVLRPSEFHWAAIFALGTATTVALFNILVKKLPSKQSILHTLFWTSVMSLPVSGVLAAGSWEPIALEHLGYIIVSSLMILSYNAFAVFAYKRAEASSIALAEYSGLVFVAIFGVIWFDEIPSILTVFGIVLIIGPLLIKRKN